MIKHDKYRQSLLDSGCCLSSVPRQSGGSFRSAQRHVRTVFNCAYWILTCPVVVHVKVVDISGVAQVCEVVGNSRDPIVAARLLLHARCVQRLANMVDNFAVHRQGVGRPCDYAATCLAVGGGTDSVHRLI